MAKAKRHARRLNVGFAGAPAGEVAATLIKAQQRVFRDAWSHYLAAHRTDPEALHDLRVESRRLRAWLRLARDVVKTRKRARRRLKRLGRSTGPMRDREVMLDLLRQVEQTPDCVDVAGRLVRLADEYETAVDEAPDFDVKPGLKPRARAETPPFHEWFDEQLSLRLDFIHRDFARGQAGFHPARIQVKHLRYLVEPFHEPFPEVGGLLEDLKAIQDRLGRLHDLVVFRERLSTYAGWLVADSLDEPLRRTGRQAQAVTRAFAGVRDQTQCLVGWQHEAFETQWKAWESERASIERRVHDACERLASSLASSAVQSD
ncbi:MAG: CHAD domain-containing protein [Halothiobacillaceae bacterium]|nr:CHAD domain-containing protein [Halothiobacillaceae bacterium]HER35402.1 CHAD domain-containing protein [Halothiobacillaceae bacterium]